MIRTPRKAGIFLQNLCGTHPPERPLGTLTARAAAAAALRHAAGSQRPIPEFLASLPGLDLLLSATRELQSESPAVHQAVVEAAASLAPYELGLIYEAARHPSLIAKEGSVYTPQWLAEEVAERAGAGLGARCRYLDPACGGGVFLLAALERCGIEKDSHAALERVHGVDRDPEAVQIARAALLVRAAPYLTETDFSAVASVVNRTIRAGDTLLDLKLFSEAAPFDAIIGNPPYGLSRDERISPAEKKALASLYESARTGKMNKYLLFMARGFDLLRRGGRLSLVVPNSWLGIASGEAVRRKLLEHGSLLEVTAFTGPVFEDPSVEVVTFLAEKEAGAGTIVINHKAALPNAAPHKAELPLTYCRNNRSSVIPLLWRPELARIFSALDEDTAQLGSDESPVRPLIALQAYARGKGTPPQTAEMVKAHVYDRTERSEPDVYPYLRGSDIRRYEYSHSGMYLKFGAWLAEPQELTRFSGPRIVLREILGAVPNVLVATFIEETALYNKSVLHILPKGHLPKEVLLALLGVLNSRCASFIIACRGQKSQRRLFPKIVNADLKAFPVPRRIFSDPHPLARLVEKRLETRNGMSSEIEHEIEATVLEYFRLKSLPEIPAMAGAAERQHDTAIFPPA